MNPDHSTEITTPVQLIEMVNAFRVSRIILTAAELKVFDYLAKTGKKSDELAVILGTKARATDRLLNALVAIGLLNKLNGVFVNTSFTETFLVSTSPDYLGGLSLTNHTWKTWTTLTDAVYTGTSLVFEKPINERPEEWQQDFIAAMHKRAGPQAREVADALDLSKTGRVLDVGGGSGAYTMEFLNRNPEMTGVVFDLPNITRLTQKYLQDAGPRFRDRVSVIAGDYLKDDFGSGYDLVFMSAIVHINSPEENQLLIRKGAEALNPDGCLVILDHIMNDDRTQPLTGALFALNMLVGTKHGDTYTEKEIRSWMLSARLTDISMIPTPSGIQLITGTRKNRYLFTRILRITR